MRQYALLAVIVALVSACGEDKGYGDPLTDPNAPLSATAAVGNAATLSTDTTNESALNALNAVSGNYNLLGGIKYQAEQGTASRGPVIYVDAACVVQTTSNITWTDCDWAGNVVNGSINRSGTEVVIDVNFFREDTTTGEQAEIDAAGTLDISPTALAGNLDFHMEQRSDDFDLRSDFNGDFDVVLAEGCAVGGQLEVHVSASSYGQSQSVWVLAEFGPACGDVVVR